MDMNLARFGAAVAYGLKRAADENDDEKKEPASPKSESGDDGKNLRRQRARNRAEDLVPMKGFGRGYADYFLPGTFGGTRAGRATMVARALGQDPDLSVSHPNTDQAISSFGGMLGGGAIGAGLGGLAGALTGDLNNAATGATLGFSGGGGLGALAGMAGAGMNRRDQLQKIQDSLAGELARHGTSRLKLDAPQYGALSSLLQPLSGAHRAGQADAYEALRNNTRYAKTPGRHAGYLAAQLGNALQPAGLAVNMAQGIGQNFSARKRMKQAPQPPIEDNYGLNEFGPAKAASAFEFGVKVANTALQGGLGGAALGAGLGGLAGAFAPGEEKTVDEHGRPVKKPKNRLMGALKGALGGGALGGAGGAALGHLAPDMVTRGTQFYNRHTPVPTPSVAVARKAMSNAGEEPFYDTALGDNAAMAVAR